MEITEVFGENLRRLREAQSLSADSLGEKVGVTGKHIYDIEKLRKKPSFDLVIEVAKHLNVKIGEMFEGETGPEPIQLPVSKTLQALMEIPDSFYKAARGISKTDPVWKMIEKSLEIAKEEAIETSNNLKNR
jgi:transcriptional regulator with XRE-family HTH domain